MSPLGPVINFGRGRGGEDLGEDHIVFREDGGGGGGGVSRQRQSIKWDCRKLFANVNLLPTRGEGKS